MSRSPRASYQLRKWQDNKRSIKTHQPSVEVPISTSMMPSSTSRDNSADNYYARVAPGLKEMADRDPVCLYLETTNRCNLLCETCPRTFEDLEKPADMSWDVFTRIVDQFPEIERVVLHGVGEPMMVRDLPRMIRYLKARGSYVLFNTNGTLLNKRKGAELIDAGLDELRVSLD